MNKLFISQKYQNMSNANAVFAFHFGTWDLNSN